MFSSKHSSYSADMVDCTFKFDEGTFRNTREIIEKDNFLRETNKALKRY